MFQPFDNLHGLHTHNIRYAQISFSFPFFSLGTHTIHTEHEDTFPLRTRFYLFELKARDFLLRNTHSSFTPTCDNYYKHDFGTVKEVELLFSMVAHWTHNYGGFSLISPFDNSTNTHSHFLTTRLTQPTDIRWVIPICDWSVSQSVSQWLTFNLYIVDGGAGWTRKSNDKYCGHQFICTLHTHGPQFIIGYVREIMTMMMIIRRYLQPLLHTLNTDPRNATQRAN